MQGISHEDKKISKGDIKHNKIVIEKIENEIENKKLQDIINSTFIGKFEEYFGLQENINDYI